MKWTFFTLVAFSKVYMNYMQYYVLEYRNYLGIIQLI